MKWVFHWVEKLHLLQVIPFATKKLWNYFDWNNVEKWNFLGAGSGIGRAACRLLNRDGATVIAADKNVDAAKDVVNSLNGKNQFINLDVASKQSVQNCVHSILSEFSAPPSIVVNAAGILRDNFILKLEEDHFDDVIRVNLKVGREKKNIFLKFLTWTFDLTHFHFKI